MEEYKQRMADEYRETRNRYDKLHHLLVLHDAGRLTFKLDTPVELLREQAAVMGRYLYILEVRAEIECVCLAMPAGPSDQVPEEVRKSGIPIVDRGYIEEWERTMRETGAPCRRP